MTKSLRPFTFRARCESQQSLLQKLHQVLHDETLLRTDVNPCTTLVQGLGDDGTDGRDLGFFQPLAEELAHAMFLGYLEKTIHLRRAGEDNGIDRAASHSLKKVN